MRLKKSSRVLLSLVLVAGAFGLSVLTKLQFVDGFRQDLILSFLPSASERALLFLNSKDITFEQTAIGDVLRSHGKRVSYPGRLLLASDSKTVVRFEPSGFHEVKGRIKRAPGDEGIVYVYSFNDRYHVLTYEL